MRRALAALAVAAAAVVVGLAVGVLARGDAAEPAGAELPLTQDPVKVTSGVEPAGAFFGQPVTARIDVQVDTSQVDPERVRVQAEFTPYASAGPQTFERVDSGRTARLTFRYPLICLREGCDPSADRGLVDFPEGRVLYVYQGETRGRVLEEAIDWAPFIVTGRVSQDAVRDIRWRATESSLAAVTYRAEPRALAGVLVALAIVLAALAGAIAWLLWGRRRPEETDAEAVEQTPLAVVLAAARAAAGNGDVPKRRRALESVARELGRIGLPDLAAEARALAWSPRAATAPEVEELAQRTELALEAPR